MKVRRTNLIVYSSHFLSCWGTRMWQFGMGMFLVRMADDSLQLAAGYGLATGIAVFFFGALVGDWVDNTPRLKAAQLSLIVTDVLMFACAAVITGYLWHQDAIRAGDSWLAPLLQAVMVVFAVLSDLAAQARLIAVERDWIVEICGKDSDHLATMTAMLRRIDMFSMIVAPIVTGQIMTYIGLVFGAIFIGSWNVLSVFVEFYLMWKVYNTVPALKAKKDARRVDDVFINKTAELHPLSGDGHHLSNGHAEEHATQHQTDGDKIHETHASNGKTQAPNGEMLASNGEMLASNGEMLASNGEKRASDGEKLASDGTTQSSNNETQHTDSESSFHTENQHQSPAKAKTENVDVEFEIGHIGVDANRPQQGGCTCGRVLSQFVTLYRGFRTYTKYNVALAGLSLAFLYMTVLGFHNITVAYAITQGLSESVLGILSGTAALFGIFGTFAYPLIRRRVGLIRTGIIALSCQVSCLTLCVASIWMPGSPFDPYYTRSGQVLGSCGTSDTSVPQQVVHGGSELTTSASNMAARNTTSGHVTFADVTTGGCPITVSKLPDSYVSLIFLMTGIFLSRFGVWIADLTITQLFLEKVVETERGIVNGFQASLNQFFDLLKYATVVALPDTETFGFLIIISFSFIASAWVVYAIFVRREGQAICSCARATEEDKRLNYNEGNATDVAV
ncbi:hypothetical protein BaRGS_00000119 [Batillaria attramentaria]|uniref:Solute carrier family 40 member n=1 Tax=Batillaria attramentaria TaxID=370345 RepID=A0ABD0M9L1_9CAEN